jgi:hypothetical protein
VVADRIRKRKIPTSDRRQPDKNEDPILLPLPLGPNGILKELPRKGRVFDARNLRKSFQAACVKVGLGVKTGAQSLALPGPASSPERSQESHPVRGSTENRHEDFGAFDRVHIRKVQHRGLDGFARGDGEGREVL